MGLEQDNNRHNNPLTQEGQRKQTPEEITREFNKHRIIKNYLGKGRDFVSHYKLAPKLKLTADEGEYVGQLVGLIYTNDDRMKMERLKKEKAWQFVKPISILAEKRLKGLQDATGVYEKFMDLDREGRKSNGKGHILEIEPDIIDIVTGGLINARKQLVKQGINPNSTRTTIFLPTNMLDWQLKLCVAKLHGKDTRTIPGGNDARVHPEEAPPLAKISTTAAEPIEVFTA